MIEQIWQQYFFGYLETKHQLTKVTLGVEADGSWSFQQCAILPPLTENVPVPDPSTKNTEFEDLIKTHIQVDKQKVKYHFNFLMTLVILLSFWCFFWHSFILWSPVGFVGINKAGTWAIRTGPRDNTKRSWTPWKATWRYFQRDGFQMFHLFFSYLWLQFSFLLMIFQDVF